MKKLFLVCTAISAMTFTAFAGGYVTNTNQSAAYLRTMARGATSDVDGVYYNPAGLMWNQHEGFSLQLNIQSAFQDRNIYADYNMTGKHPISKKYTGEAVAPVIPSLYATYKEQDWVFSAYFGIVGGGGTCKFDNGLAMFDMLVQSSSLAAGLTPDLYNITSSLDGTKIIYGFQLGATYKITDWLSAFAGARMNYISAGYEGNLSAKTKIALPNGMPADYEFTSIALDCEQTGFGVTPILGLSAKWGDFSLNAKYEFNTAVELENETKTATIGGQPENGSGPLAAYADGVKTDADIPAILFVAAGYDILPSLRATIEYHQYFDEQASMANGRQKLLDGCTKEYLASLEWDINKKWTVSAGCQRTNYDGTTDSFQSDTDFFCSSWATGVGLEYNINEKMAINFGYMQSFYEDYDLDLVSAAGKFGTKTYERTSKTFGLSFDYKF